MKSNILLLSSLVAVSLLVGCDKGSEQKTADNATSVAAPAAPAANSGFGPVINAGKQAVTETKEAAGEAATAVQENVTNAADQAVNAAQDTGTAIATGAEKTAEAAGQAVEGAAQAVANDAAKAVEEIKK
ncbi:MAG: hypothetical protein NTV00_07545 [Methylococcales bacterium]|nr:hypothetical protein [Methylococcales bacterium]